jgi:hypothetical protein
MEARLRLDAKRMKQTVEAEIAKREGHAAYVEQVLPEFLAAADRLEKGVRTLAEGLQFADVDGLRVCVTHVKNIVENIQAAARTYRAGIEGRALIAATPAQPTPAPKLDDRPTGKFFDARGRDWPKFADGIRR